MFDRSPFLLRQPRSEEAEQRRALAVAVAVDERFVGRNRRIRNRTGGRSQLLAQIRALKVSRDALDRHEVEGLVAQQRAADRSTRLFAMELLELGAIREIAGEPF